MSGKVIIRFVAPAPIKERNSSGAVIRTRTWNTEKILGYLHGALESGVQGVLKLPVTLEVVEARASDIRFEGFKPGKVTEAREAIGELIGDAMGEIDPEEYLTA